jgi:hypothetical protein
MAFKPNYNQMRAERQRNARARGAERQKRLDEKTAERKAAREAANAGTDAPADAEVAKDPPRAE